ncbi:MULTISPECIES: hypothetical protein [unclassified Sphingobacterium]|uniref:hypothetical protein n=1 Tax=unclassified Sphingobacterium TaxID=2609468 RepID=UPI00265D055C|nr:MULTISPECIES: hypothetical protein [unclassified Sphingobacterium]WKK59511.1 hypothetical protein QYC40_04590 [Sphingobacterium sp. BN32]
MDNRKIFTSNYVPPRLTSEELELEGGIAAVSAAIRPGGGTDNASPWVTEETEETINKDWGITD